MLAVGLTRNLVAARADLASTRTIGNMAEAFITNVIVRDQSQGEGRFDRVLDGPTNEVWIDPWVAHLQSLGVRFKVGVTVESLRMRRGRIASAVVRDLQGRAEAIDAEWFVCALPVERALPLWNRQIRAADPKLAQGERADYGLDERDPVLPRPPAAAGPWAHSFIDSPWALTALSQQQFWPSSISPAATATAASVTSSRSTSPTGRRPESSTASLPRSLVPRRSRKRSGSRSRATSTSTAGRSSTRECFAPGSWTRRSRSRRAGPPTRSSCWSTRSAPGSTVPRPQAQSPTSSLHRTTCGPTSIWRRWRGRTSRRGLPSMPCWSAPGRQPIPSSSSTSSITRR